MKDYFICLPDRGESIWGCTATSVGYSRVPAGSPYPPHQHPIDHHFTWSDGRILHAYQIVFITEGAGTFESAATRSRQRIEAGTVFVLFPAVWHRYAPDPKTGWVEHWIECRGRVFDQARAKGIVRPEKPLFYVGPDPDLLLLFDRCHSLAQRRTPGNQAALSTLGLHILAMLVDVAKNRANFTRKTDEMIERAHRLIAERYQEPLKMEQLARELNIGYSHLRQLFKEHTGSSLKQYHLQVRLQKAQDLLANTTMSVTEVADLLGFDSPFHLSKQFKSRTGLAPQHWRDRLSRPKRL